MNVEVVLRKPLPALCGKLVLTATLAVLVISWGNSSRTPERRQRAGQLFGLAPRSRDADDAARFLAGLPGKYGTSFRSLEENEVWTVHRQELDRDWSRLETQWYPGMRRFQKTELADKSAGKGLKVYLEEVRETVASELHRSFFITREMDRQFRGQVTTFLKATSYMPHHPGFSIIRNVVLDNSTAILQDDSGLPYHLYDNKRWQVQLYGDYDRPYGSFSWIEQPDLKKAHETSKPKPLGFRIGYGFSRIPSNLLLATRQR